MQIDTIKMRFIVNNTNPIHPFFFYSNMIKKEKKEFDFFLIDRNIVSFPIFFIFNYKKQREPKNKQTDFELHCSK